MSFFVDESTDGPISGLDLFKYVSGKELQTPEKDKKPEEKEDITDEPNCSESSPSVQRKSTTSVYIAADLYINNELQSSKQNEEEPPKGDDNLPIMTKFPNFKCNICGKYFRKRYRYEDHMFSHSGHEPYSCKVCGKRFSIRGSWMQHEQGHNGIKFNCAICGKDFTRKGSLKEHMLSLHGQKSFKCELCGQRFGRFSQLDTHLLKHSGERPFPCDICGKRFISKDNARNHMATHGEKKFFCDLCGKSFARGSSIKRHKEKMHSGDASKEKVACQICKKEINRSNFESHMLRHLDPELFPCEFCGKVFRKKYNLKQHTLTHTDERPHSCKLCGESFRYIGSLKYHMNKMHQGTASTPGTNNVKENGGGTSVENPPEKETS